MRRLLSVSIAALVVAGLAACSAGDDVEVFASVDAGGASFADGTLTLTGLDHGVVFLTVEPEHAAWTGAPADLAASFPAGEALNAVVVSPSSGASYAFEVTGVTVDDAGTGLTFAAAPIAEPGDDVMGHASGELVDPPAGDLGRVTLFLDPYLQRRTPGVYVASDAGCTITIDNVEGYSISADYNGNEYLWDGPDQGASESSAQLSYTYSECSFESATVTLSLSDAPEGPASVTLLISGDGVQLDDFANTNGIKIAISGTTVTISAR